MKVKNANGARANGKKKKSYHLYEQNRWSSRGVSEPVLRPPEKEPRRWNFRGLSGNLRERRTKREGGKRGGEKKILLCQSEGMRDRKSSFLNAFQGYMFRQKKKGDFHPG